MADTDTIEENPIARAILHERSRYQWTVQVGGAKAISSHMWLRSPEQVATLKTMFGGDHPAHHADQPSGWNPAADFVQDMVRHGERMTRGQYLRRRQAIDSAAGMAEVARPLYRLEMTWSPIGFGDKRVPALSRHYVRVLVQWFPDNTIVLESEDVASASDEVVSLFVFKGCIHDFKHAQLSSRGTYHRYTCNHCGYSYDIDSGD